MTRTHLPFRCLLFVGALLATTYPLPAPVTVLPPESTPPPKSTRKSPAAAPTKPPLKPPNAHGVPDGTYNFPVRETPGGYGSFKEYDHFTVHGNSFDWFKTSDSIINEAGNKVGRHSTKIVYKMSGVISRQPDGTLEFKAQTAQIVSRSPPDYPDSNTMIANLRAMTQRPEGWKLTYANGRIFEPSTGHTWTFQK